MRILQMSTYFLTGGGIQRHVTDLTAWLRAQGHAVFLAGALGRFSGLEDDAGYVPLPLGQVAMADVTGRANPLPRRLVSAARAAHRLRRALPGLGVDLVHAHETAPLLVAWLASRGLGIPIVLSFHGAAPARLRSVARTARRFADLVVSPSRLALDELVRHGLPAARARHIGLGVPPLPPVAPDRAAALRRALLGGAGGPLVLSLSRLAPQKGIDVLVEVARRVAPTCPGARFVVAGHGPLEGEVAAWAAAAGVAERVRFLGLARNVPELLAASDLFLLTSRWEALPISIVEAFRAGLPVIATDCGGVRELVSPEVGRLCPVGDAGALSTAVLELAGDAALARALGAAARRRSAEERFSPDHVHARFEALYATLLGGAPSVAA
jgi:glycosyltransferase involved in cell wall biosynthesis